MKRLGLFIFSVLLVFYLTPDLTPDKKGYLILGVKTDTRFVGNRASSNYLTRKDRGNHSGEFYQTCAF